MPTPRRLWVIDPSVNHPERQGIGEVLRAWTGESRLFFPGLKPGDGPGPETGYATDGVVVLGSSASVHDEPPWLAKLGSWLRPLVAGEVRLPLLGICFGHQLIAHLAGAGVGYVSRDRRKLVEVATSLLDEGRLLPGRHELRVLVSHREEVSRVPPGYRVTAARPSIAVDGLEHDSLPVFTFQFHPEAREDFARHAGLDPSAVDPRLREDGQLVLGAFRALVAGGERRPT